MSWGERTAQQSRVWRAPEEMGVMLALVPPKTLRMKTLRTPKTLKALKVIGKYEWQREHVWRCGKLEGA
jgi:hypothetical protein